MSGEASRQTNRAQALVAAVKKEYPGCAVSWQGDPSSGRITLFVDKRDGTAERVLALNLALPNLTTKELTANVLKALEGDGR